jgi:molybdate transport system permease protein
VSSNVRAQRGYATYPRWLFLPAAIGGLLIAVPLVAIATKVNWGDFGALITSQASLDALGLSLFTSLIAAAICVVLGVPLAMILARSSFPGQRFLRALVLVPLVLPPVVGGLALLYTFGRLGLLGGAMNFLGIDIAFSTTAVIIAQTFVSLPFLVVSLEGTLRTSGDRFEAAAATLGSGRWSTFLRVTLPMTLPGIASGALLSFARSLGEFGATITFAGSLQGVTRTLPLEIYQERELDPDAAVALSLLLIGVALVVVLLARGRARE